MKISDLLTMCVQNLRRRKFRTFLTVVGVVIGTCAIISMISLGIGINKSNSDFISTWGDLSIIDVYGAREDVALDDKTLANISAMEYVDAVTPFVNAMNFEINYDSAIYAGKNDRYKTGIWNLTGVYPEALEKLGYRLAEGKMISKDGKYIQLVVGGEVPYMFEDTKRKYPNNMVNPYPDERGQIKPPFVDTASDIFTIKIPYGAMTGNESTQKFLTYEAKVVGILESDDMSSYETRNSIYIDATDLRKIADDYRKANKSTNRQPLNYQQVRVRVEQLEEVSNVQAKIEEMGFYTFSMEYYRQEAMKKTQQMQMILGALGAISLFVAAISIANTMVMSVYERTREIGIMKVLGCFVSDIRKIFLSEAAMIGFFGGIIGVALSYGISAILNAFGGGLGEAMGLIAPIEGTEMKLSIIPLWLVLLGMGFATGIGIAAGIYPAYRAVKISALEAIKQE